MSKKSLTGMTAEKARETIMKNKETVEKHIKNGVIFINPDAVYIEADVEIGRDTVIEPNVMLQSGAKIGSGCIIGMGSKIIASSIGNGTEILSGVIVESEIGENVQAGPFAYVRPGSKIGNNVKVGDFVEVKNSTVDEGTKIAHLTYVGDSDVGKRVNFGCGTVTVNYDGKNKHRTTIGDDCFIGCNTNLVAPVTVNDGAYTAAGSTITDEVPAETLAIARARQVNKTGWHDKRK